MESNINHVVWKYAKEPVTEEAIEGAEMALGVIFPEAVKNVYRKVNGGGPRPNELSTLDGDAVKIRFFLPIGADYADNLVQVNKMMRAAIPEKHLLVIANDDFGNYFCVDTKMSGWFRLFYWHHETGKLAMIKQKDSEKLYNVIMNQ